MTAIPNVQSEDESLTIEDIKLQANAVVVSAINPIVLIVDFDFFSIGLETPIVTIFIFFPHLYLPLVRYISVVPVLLPSLNKSQFFLTLNVSVISI